MAQSGQQGLGFALFSSICSWRPDADREGERQTRLPEPTAPPCPALGSGSCPEPVLRPGALTSLLPLLSPVAHTPSSGLGSCSEDNESADVHVPGSDVLASMVSASRPACGPPTFSLPLSPPPGSPQLPWPLTSPRSAFPLPPPTRHSLPEMSPLANSTRVVTKESSHPHCLGHRQEHFFIRYVSYGVLSDDGSRLKTGAFSADGCVADVTVQN